MLHEFKANTIYMLAARKCDILNKTQLVEFKGQNMQATLVSYIMCASLLIFPVVVYTKHPTKLRNLKVAHHDYFSAPDGVHHHAR